MRNTHAKTVMDFDEIYSGPEFTIMERLTDAIVMILCAFLFGAGQPILFWLALLYFFLQYTFDRLQMAYSYRRPPMLGNELNLLAIWMMSLGPWLYLIVGIWVFSNQ